MQNGEPEFTRSRHDAKMRSFPKFLGKNILSRGRRQHNDNAVRVQRENFRTKGGRKPEIFWIGIGLELKIIGHSGNGL